MQFSILRAITIGRWLVIRLRYGVKFGRPGYIGRGFSLQMEPDGYALGGTFECGPGARFSEGVIVAPYGGSIQIGRDFFCGPYTLLYGHGGLRIGNQVMIAGHCVIIPANHNVDDPLKPISAQGEARRGITIEDDVWIGCGVRILDGIRIESGAVIGAGAVVLRDVPGRAVMAGVPARVIRLREGRGKS